MQGIHTCIPETNLVLIFVFFVCVCVYVCVCVCVFVCVLSNCVVFILVIFVIGHCAIKLAH